MLPPLRRPDSPRTNGMAGPRGLAVLGATGSIGRQTLEVVRLFPEKLRVRALGAGRDWEALAALARELRPDLVAIADEGQGAPLAEALAGTGVRVATGREGLIEAATLAGADVVVAVPPAPAGAGIAVRDRLRRAAASGGPDLDGPPPTG